MTDDKMNKTPEGVDEEETPQILDEPEAGEPAGIEAEDADTPEPETEISAASGEEQAVAPEEDIPEAEEPAPVEDKPPFPQIDDPSGGGSPAKEDFKPYYQKEARNQSIYKGMLYVLFVVLGISLLGLTVEAFFLSAPFRLEVAVIAVVCIALTGLLWRTISMQVKAGLAALGVAALLAVNQAAAPDLALSFFDLAPGLVLPIFYTIAALACLIAVWLLRPRPKWLPPALSVLFLYGAVSPIAAIVYGGADLAGITGGPALMETWPLFVRSGWLTVQVLLPLGVLIMLILQVRALFRPQFDKHWGFLFWALFLAVASAIGLLNLERSEQPAFPRFAPAVASLYPEANRPQPKIKTPAAGGSEATTPATPSVETAAGPATTDVPAPEPSAPDQPAAGLTPGDQPAPEVDAADQTAAAREPEKEVDQPGETASVTPEAEVDTPEAEVDTAEPAPPAILPEESAAAPADESIEELKAEVRRLRKELADQRALLEEILHRLGEPAQSPERPEMPSPLPGGEEPLIPPPAEPAPPDSQDFT